MDLLEYQAKELFKQVGIPILPSQTIHHISDLKRLQIPYPLVLKSQVRAGGRGKAGGVRFVENTIDAIAAAAAIFHLAIAEEYPEVILAEARYDSQQEFFLAIVLDYQRQCPVLLGSSQGGIDVETLLQHMQSINLTEPFSPFHARRLAIQMGLKGALVPAVSGIIEKMYVLFQRYDLDLIEINPLGVRQGEVMALDGKIAANDQAMARHPDLCSLVETQPREPRLLWLKGDLQQGQVGLICNSYGLAVSSWDLLQEEDLGVLGAYLLDETREAYPLATQLQQALAGLGQYSQLQLILINLITQTATYQDIAEALVSLLPDVTTVASDDRLIRATGTKSSSGNKGASPTLPWQACPLIIRFSQGDLSAYQTPFPQTAVYWFHDLGAAIAKAQTLLASSSAESFIE
ncbi:ATP-grasp domain-containing protein [Synechocystis sp. LKSZ1]|uniref:ATP-grasp domain-containing protein n=1 Tax=Synechocystis sp. LKSZ1 TaxID=3144951 RepID=UPI00336BBA56